MRTQTLAKTLTVLTVCAFTSSVASAKAAGPEAPSSSPVVVRVENGGFRWGDAAIGAAAGFGACLAAAGGLALRRDRPAAQPVTAPRKRVSNELERMGMRKSTVETRFPRIDNPSSKEAGHE